MSQRAPGTKAYYTAEEFYGACAALGEVIGGSLGALHAAILHGELGEPIPHEIVARMRFRFEEAKQKLKVLMPGYEDKIDAMK